MKSTSLQLVREEVADARVGSHRCVEAHVVHDLGRRPGLHRRALDHLRERPLHLVEGLDGRRAESDVAFGELGDDVLRGSAFGDDPVDARVRREVLSPPVDRDE